MIVTLDFETAYSKEYSLSRMSEVDYILDPRFEVLLCGIKVGTRPVIIPVGHERVAREFEAIDWSKAAVLSHNTRFDGAILAWRFGVWPRLWLDTLSMARAVTHAYIGASSLDAVARHMGLAPKGTAVSRMVGKWLTNFTSEEIAEYKSYCEHDTELCRAIFDRFMVGGFPHDELKVIDLFLRMYIEPQARLNTERLAGYLAEVQAEKAATLSRLNGLDRSVFSSNIKFAELLADQGVEVPTKISTTTGKKTFALAKNDREFRELCEDPEQTPYVQALLAARIGVKSTIAETRAATLLNLSQRCWPGGGAGWMPAPYRYYGAHTGRPSGDGGFNFANLMRGSALREAIEAPPGFRIVHRDSSQIEARMCAWLARCESLITAFRQGRDVYSEFASQFYGVPVTKADTKRRFAGKTAILQLGYGSSAAKLRHMLFIGAGGVSLDISEHAAAELVRFYRNEAYPEIPKLWLQAHGALRFMSNLGLSDMMVPMPVVVPEREKLHLPNGMCLRYPGLTLGWNEEGKQDFHYDAPRNGGRKKIYGAKLVENICQALARIVITDVMLRVRAATGYAPFMMTYDSTEYMVPEDEAGAFDEVLACEYAITPSWAPGLPLASEGGFGRTLLDAERMVNQ